MGFLVLLVGSVVAVAGWISGSAAAGTIGMVLGGIGVLLIRRAYVPVRPPGAARFDGLRMASVVAKRRGDYAEAERLLMEAVEAGDPEAMFDMGRLVEERDGFDASVRWFRMAAENGHKIARRAFRPGEVFNRDGSTPLDN